MILERDVFMPIMQTLQTSEPPCGENYISRNIFKEFIPDWLHIYKWCEAYR